MPAIQTNPAKRLAKQLTRSAIPIRPTAVVRRLATHVLSQTPSRVVEIKVGEVNRVFRVDIAEKTVVARVQFYRDFTQRYHRERESMAEALQSGVRVPEIIAIGRWHSHSYMILQFIAQSNGGTHPILKKWFHLGEVARRLSSRLWPTTPERWNTHVEKTLRTITHNDLIVRSGVLTAREFDKAVGLVADLALLRIDRVFQHGDLKPENLILDRKGKCWLLDWSSAGGYPRHHALIQVYCCAEDPREFRAFRSGYGMSEEEWEAKRVELRPLIVSFLLNKIFWNVRAGIRNGEALERHVTLLRTLLTPIPARSPTLVTI